MEGKIDLSKVSKKDSKPPGKVRGKTYTIGNQEHPYSKGGGGGGTGDKPCKRCARKHCNQEQCPAIGQTCFKCKMIGHLKAACRKLAPAAVASITVSNPVAASLNYIGQVSGNTTVVLHLADAALGRPGSMSSG